MMEQRFTKKLSLSKHCLAFLIMLSFFLFSFEATHASQPQTSSLFLKIKDFSKEIPYEEYSSWFSYSTKLVKDSSYLSEIENIYYCPEKEIICEIAGSRKSNLHYKKIIIPKFDDSKTKIFLEKFSQESKKEPINARFQISEDRVSTFAIEESGFEIDIEKSLTKISKEFSNDMDLQKQREIDLPYNEIIPEVKSADLNSLGIDTLLGQGKSNFKGSPKGRVHNISVATKRYEGILIAPGEEFSFVEILGPVDGENGYLPELVIKNNKTEPEFGGGICQVSTTAFRAAIYAGLEITARKNHAYPVSYYNPQGMDATIYIPKPDLKFKNNTPGSILIQTEIKGTELTFNFFGTNDGRKIEVDGPYITEKNPDGSMKTTFTQKVSDKNGTIILNEIFGSFYDSPSKYPHPGEEIFTKKPEDWSKKQWEIYKKVHNR